MNEVSTAFEEKEKKVNWYLCTLFFHGKVMEKGWMLGEDDEDLIRFAQKCEFGIEIEYLGEADMSSALPKIKENDNG